MPETLEKLRPDRDLQCYFERPSAIAALSGASANGFTVSGCWRQQFDWAVVEWNRDNVFEHPAFRNLPDGDLSGLRLTYEEVRTNCIPIDSSLFPTVDWPYLRIWAANGGSEQLYKVRLTDHATPVEGEFRPACAEFELKGTPTAGDYVELAWSTEHYGYELRPGDLLANAALAIVDAVNAFSDTMTASRDGVQITLRYKNAGANGNRVGVYGNIRGTGTEAWEPASQALTSGTSPGKWRIELDFGTLTDEHSAKIPTQSIRKMRWTYAAELQPASFVRSEFQVEVTNWTVTGSDRLYKLAGPGSRRIEDDDLEVKYSGPWSESRGNFSGGSIRCATEPGASILCKYAIPTDHGLYLGTRLAQGAATISIVVDDQPAQIEHLDLPGEDVLARIALGSFAGAMEHTLHISHCGVPNSSFYFDFIEAAVPCTELPVFPRQKCLTLATDWDTDHSIALPPERTAWMIRSLGFEGRANHYVGALWFYEMYCKGHAYATGTVTFSGMPASSQYTEIRLGFRNSQDPPQRIVHLNLIGDTAQSIAKALALEINTGYTSVWAQADGPALALTARAMGAAGNEVSIEAIATGTLVAVASGPALCGGVDGLWRTDVQATPRMNRSARDWTRSFFRALSESGISGTGAFSMELQHGDPDIEAGIAQRYPSGAPVLLNTPALQTNFSPASEAFWRQAYIELAMLMVEGGQSPYLQFGEAQWWYFAYDESGMPYYDAYTTQEFAARYGRDMHVFTNSDVDPAQFPDETEYLSSLIGNFTSSIAAYVRLARPETRFEVLYAPDVNESRLDRVVNLPIQWSPAAIDCFKTENFTYTGNRDLESVKASIQLGTNLGFRGTASSHLVGIGDYTAPWEKEIGLALSEGCTSVVLFALDQFCLIGFKLPLGTGVRRSVYMG